MQWSFGLWWIVLGNINRRKRPSLWMKWRQTQQCRGVSRRCSGPWHNWRWNRAFCRRKTVIWRGRLRDYELSDSTWERRWHRYVLDSQRDHILWRQYDSYAWLLYIFGHHQVEMERGKLRHQLSQTEAGVLVWWREYICVLFWLSLCDGLSQKYPIFASRIYFYYNIILLVLTTSVVLVLFIYLYNIC